MVYIYNCQPGSSKSALGDHSSEGLIVREEEIEKNVSNEVATMK